MAYYLRSFSIVAFERYQDNYDTNECLICNEMMRRISLSCASHIRYTKKPWTFVPDQVMKYSTTQKSKGTFYIRKLNHNDKKSTIAFLNRLFFRDEPMNHAVKLLEGPNDRCIELEEYVVNAMDDGISVAAVSDKEELVGVVINSLLFRNKIVKEDIESCPNPKFKSILRLLTHLDTQSRYWEKVPSNCNTVVDLKIASTDPNWRKRNIMKMLAEETERLARKSGACGIHINATSHYSARAAQKLGYQKIYCVTFAKIQDGPQPEPPHVEACVYLKLL